MSWFGRLNRKLTDRLDQKTRLMQIKMLYQNQAASDYLLLQLEQAEKMGLSGADGLRSSLREAQLETCNAIVELAANMRLSDGELRRQHQIQKELIQLYNDTLAGRRRAKDLGNGSNGDLKPFMEMFAPETGWDSFGDEGWDAMRERAIEIYSQMDR